MKINWRIRFKNPYFITQILLAIGVPVLAYFGLTTQDLTTWDSLFTITLDALRNPYVLGMVLVSVWNAVNDPVVKGLSDSKEAMKYSELKESKK